MSSGAVVRELVPPDTQLAYAAMHALRPGLGSQREFVDRVDEVQRSEGYRLVAVVPDGSDHAVAVAGFRLGHSLAWGRYLYIDDVSTVPAARRLGYAGMLLDWLIVEARRLDCDQVHLDSGLSPERFDAHRLYLNHGFAMRGLHFGRTADDS